jgi:hypothetical protein
MGNLKRYLAFQSFNYVERDCWRLLQKRVMRLKLDIYVNVVRILVYQWLKSKIYNIEFEIEYEWRNTNK